MALKRYQETFGSVLANGDVFVLAGASVEVRDETSGALAAIFSDRAGNTAKANPFTADSNGYGFFYADDGRYRITATLSGETVDVRDVLLGVGSTTVTTSTGDQPLAEALDERAIYVKTIANLRALVSSALTDGQASIITTTVRAGSFTWVTGDQSANITADPQGGVWIAPDSDATGASGAYRRNYWIGDGLRAEWWGVDYSTADNGPLVQAAVDYADSAGVQIVNLPPGTLDWGTKVTWQYHNITLRGAGSGKTKINVTYTADDVIVVGDGVTEVTGTRIEGLSINAASAMTSGWAIRMRKTGRTTLDDVIVCPQGESKNIYNGIQFAAFDNVMVGRTLVRSLNDGMEIYGDTGQSYGAEIVLGNMTRIIGCDRYGVHVGGSAGGVKFGDIDIISSGTENVRISTELSTEHNREIFFGALCTIDSCGSNCIRILDSSFEHIDMSGTWVASGGQTNNDQGGINVSATQRTQAFLKMSGLRVYNHNGPGISISGGRFLLSGSVIRNCGLTSTVTADGIYLPNPNATRFTLTGNEFIDCGNGGLGYGINLESTSFNNFAIVGNVVVGNQQAGIRNASGTNSTSKRVDLNVV